MNRFIDKKAIANVALLATAFALATPTQGASTNVAAEYMRAYSIFDVGALASFYSENALFRDPTSEVWGESAWNMDGKADILRRIESFASKYDNVSIDYNVREQYESAGYNVFTGKAKISYEKDGTLETRCLLVTTIVTTKDGKVAEHRDYFDYANYEASKKAGDQIC